MKFVGISKYSYSTNPSAGTLYSTGICRTTSGWPMLPSFGERRRGGQVLRIPFGRAAVRPPRRGCLFSAADRLRSLANFPCFGSACHGGIVAVRHLIPDRLRPRPRVLVGEQRHRPDLAGPVAAHAVLVEDRRDVLVERRHVLRRLRRVLSGAAAPTIAAPAPSPPRRSQT